MKWYVLSAILMFFAMIFADTRDFALMMLSVFLVFVTAGKGIEEEEKKGK